VSECRERSIRSECTSWCRHDLEHVITEYLGRATSVLIRLNLLLLMVVSFLPFATELLGDYIGEDAPEHKAELSGRA
jgi:uncharacterized membrane protein